MGAQRLRARLRRSSAALWTRRGPVGQAQAVSDGARPVRRLVFARGPGTLPIGSSARPCGAGRWSGSFRASLALAADEHLCRRRGTKPRRRHLRRDGCPRVRGRHGRRGGDHRTPRMAVGALRERARRPRRAPYGPGGSAREPGRRCPPYPRCAWGRDGYPGVGDAHLRRIRDAGERPELHSYLRRRRRTASGLLRRIRAPLARRSYPWACSRAGR